MTSNRFRKMWQTVQNNVVVNLCCTWYFPISGQVIIVMWLRAVGYSNRPVLTFRMSQWCERGEQANTLACYAHEAQSQGEWNNTGDQFLKCIFLPVEFLKHNLNWFSTLLTGLHPFAQDSAVDLWRPQQLSGTWNLRTILLQLSRWWHPSPVFL